MVLIFLLLGNEVKTFRKMVLVAPALRKKYIADLVQKQLFLEPK
jgi:hypothetical protein